MKKEEILAKCIEEIRSGRSTIEDCASSYPHLAKELRALLEVALQLKPDEAAPSAEFIMRAKMHLFDDDLKKMPVARGFWNRQFASPAKAVLAYIVIGVVVILGVGGGTVYAAQSSLPGDTLYPVKTGVENVQLAITTSATTKANLYLKFAQRRIDEVTQEVKQNREVSPQALGAVEQQYNSALNELSDSDNTKANDNTLSRLSVATLNQQVELQQTLAAAPQSSQPVIQQIINTAQRGNVIAQVAYANHDLLKNQPSVTDKKLDAGQFNIEGTLNSIQDKTWNVGGTAIENVHLSGDTPAIGSRVSLQGIVKDNKTFISKITVTANSTEPTEVKGQFNGTNANGTADVSGLPVTLNNPVSTPLTPGDNVHLQSSNNNSKMDVTAVQGHNDQNTTLEGTLISIDTGKGIVIVKITGSQVTVNIKNAQFTDKSNSHAKYQVSDLKQYVGHDIKLDGLSKKDNVFYAKMVTIDPGK